jgi:hypothetical protein
MMHPQFLLYSADGKRGSDMTNNMLRNQEAAKQSKPSERIGLARRDLLRKAMVASGVIGTINGDTGEPGKNGEIELFY